MTLPLTPVVPSSVAAHHLEALRAQARQERQVGCRAAAVEEARLASAAAQELSAQEAEGRDAVAAADHERLGVVRGKAEGPAERPEALGKAADRK